MQVALLGIASLRDVAPSAWQRAVTMALKALIVGWGSWVSLGADLIDLGYPWVSLGTLIDLGLINN